MAVMDEFREEREALKNGTRQQKLEYFWLYYKWHLIVGIAAVIAITSFVYNLITQKDTALYVLMLNSFATAEDAGEAYKQDFLKAANIDTDEYDAIIDSSLYMDLNSMDEMTYSTVQKIGVYVAAKELDLFAGDEEIFKHHAYLDYMADLRDVLTPEQIEKYSSDFFYIDREVLKAKDAANDALEEYTLPYPDPKKPEDMADPVPVGIFLNNVSEEFKNNYSFKKKDSGVIGVIINTTHPENAQSYIDYIFTSAE